MKKRRKKTVKPIAMRAVARSIQVIPPINEFPRPPDKTSPAEPCANVGSTITPIPIKIADAKTVQPYPLSIFGETRKDTPRFIRAIVLAKKGRMCAKS